jgi:hypothetical protein
MSNSSININEQPQCDQHYWQERSIGTSCFGEGSRDHWCPPSVPRESPGSGLEAKSLGSSRVIQQKEWRFIFLISLEVSHEIQIVLPFLTKPIRSNYNFNVLCYSDRSLVEARMDMLIYTVGNFNAERNNAIHIWEKIPFELLFIMNYSFCFTCISLWSQGADFFC